MFHIYFLGSSEGLVFDVTNANFDVSLWNPLQRYLTERGVRFHTGTEVLQVGPSRTKEFCVDTDSGENLDAHAVVLATDVTGLQRIVANSPNLGGEQWRHRIARLRAAAPFVVQRIWLDTPVRRDRPAFLGTAGHKPLDHISVLERYESEAATWATHHRGSVVEMHAYAISSDLPRAAVTQCLHQLYPETASARVVYERTLQRRDCALFAPGTFGSRPTVSTPHPNLVLAGDGIRIDLPVALMERAATTGWSAANELLKRWGLAGHPLCSVPNQGRSALLRSLATRASGPR
ncbi:NAD(P)/FAD-dependent oxidoreductase [Mycobacterium simiae]|uniref:NAD(P)/FAD-dependent oxidoreductase n=2 Tax=Mycobacterium simiae TaxID=1784 RepID=A0A5B1BQX8_MYCSI|nr:NAD(P)/FAD-dependent oxidoreductase [Mycobacterium simiae]